LRHLSIPVFAPKRRPTASAWKIAITGASLVAYAGLAGPAQARTACGKNTGICIFHEPGSRVIGWQFRGGEITHFNLRFTRTDGRLIQMEWNARASNQASFRFNDIETGDTTFSVQACNKKNLVFFNSRSACTGWMSVTVRIDR
jgi:hypothetical protein